MTDTLRTTLVQSETEAPSRHMLVLHGIYGRGRNWTTVARDLVRQRPDWACVLVDLPGHGSSPDPSPPHTITAAADDVSATEAALGVQASAVAGHSFGGKVALTLADGRRRLEQVWVIDSTPEARIPEGSAWGMVEAIRSLPGDFASRAEATVGLMNRGYAEPVAAWMSSNLVNRDGRYRWRLDFDVMEALLRDFFDRDLWHIVESPPDGCVLHFVKASQSSTLTEAACRRIEAAAASSGRVHLHRIDSGHWVNADNPEALTALMARHLPDTAHAR